MARVSHPNVASIYDFGIADGRPYLVMEYVEGGDLKRAIRPLARSRWSAVGRVRGLIEPIESPGPCRHCIGTASSTAT